ncbi:protein FAR-RED IMPAIRED RESPONSE 1-like [Silene latifolia]|uniref:protein FAR-RED IMPAIRED RESPONSE 1-like n=1 Tax=Silene latifolia TaxID=37657 RepID=UPI003D78117E
MTVNRQGFFFDYDVDSDGSLSKAIWADGIARRNYSVFGDAVLFDPTYSTNKYDMAFTPFTGVDHHKRSVRFCDALVAHEDAGSFQWVFSRFLVAMGEKEPKYIITDQDPRILKAVPIVFKTARHRYCMWHIMNKVLSKFGVTREDYSEFVKKLNAIIWDEDIEAAEFDAKWEEIGQEHTVNNINWFKEMYSKRKHWVMAHCRDLEMGGVMRTTQRSESENSFFKRFESKSGTLVEFSLRFDSVMDQQRHTQKKLDNGNRHTSPQISTHLDIEMHRAQVYSHKVLEEFQEEVKYSIDTCKSRGFSEAGSSEVTTVRDANRDINYQIHLKQLVAAECLKGKALYAGIWCKDEIRTKMFDCNGEAAEDVDIIDGNQIAMSVMWSEIHKTVAMLMGKLKADVDNFSSVIREFKEKLSPYGSPMNKQQQLEKILGCSASQEITILPPKQSKNKGSGKRMLSLKAKAAALASKPKRMCRYPVTRQGREERMGKKGGYATADDGARGLHSLSLEVLASQIGNVEGKGAFAVMFM